VWTRSAREDFPTGSLNAPQTTLLLKLEVKPQDIFGCRGLSLCLVRGLLYIGHIPDTLAGSRVRYEPPKPVAMYAPDQEPSYVFVTRVGTYILSGLARLFWFQVQQTGSIFLMSYYGQG